MLTQIEERALWIALVLILCISGALYLEHRGAEKCKSQDQSQVASQIVHNATVEAQQADAVAQEKQAYEQAVVAPLEPVTVRLCYPRDIRSVPEAPAAGRRVTAAPAVPAEARSDPVPELQRSAQAADAQIAGLIDYVNRVCLKR